LGEWVVGLLLFRFTSVERFTWSNQEDNAEMLTIYRAFNDISTTEDARKCYLEKNDHTITSKRESFPCLLCDVLIINCLLFENTRICCAIIVFTDFLASLHRHVIFSSFMFYPIKCCICYHNHMC
ncbi:hypothetical protein ACJX0J_012556, partial [Zea mays]